MKKTHVKSFSHKCGAALVYVIIAFMVMTIFSVAVISIVFSNLNQVQAQERDLQAYYLSLSGTDLCMAALLQQGVNGANDTLLYKAFDPTTKPNPVTITDSLTLDGGVVDLTVKAISKNGQRWIEITSVATLSESTQTETTTLQFQYSNYLIQVRS